jgi:aminopeptidase YwaD
MDIPKVARECINETAELIRRFGPRLAGSEASRDTARALAEGLAGHCDSVLLESFDVHPASFYSYTKILPILYALGGIALFLPRPLALIPAIGLAVGFLIMLCQFALYLHFPDFLFPKKKGWNLSAVIEPTGKPERELILSGHHDSAPIARIFSSPFAKLYAVAVFLPYAFFAFEFVLLAIRFAAVFGGASDEPRAWSIVALAAGLPFVIGYFLLIDTGRGSPGAGDNLVSSVMVAHLGRELSRAGGSPLETTRLRIVSFDAEEAGLRGSAAWFRAHGKELAGLPCFHLNFDSLYALKDMQVLTSDVNGEVRLSGKMATELVSLAAAEGVDLKPFSMPFGGGATDAAEGARVGVEAVSIIAMPTSVLRDDLVYHTPGDTADRIEASAVEACLRIALRFAVGRYGLSPQGSTSR